MQIELPTFHTAWAQPRHASRARRCLQLGVDRKTYARRRETGKE